MPRRRRSDWSGAWQHVGNRALAHRTLFEGRADCRYFLSRVARVVRAGLIEVHAFSLLTTHFHLLVRSRGELSRAMNLVENQYVRWFNRRRERDGPLFRGRFFARNVTSETYWNTVVRYIDANAVDAGLARDPAGHPYCSAACYARASGPPWLCRSTIEETVRERRALPFYDPAAYRLVFGNLGDDVRELAEHRTRSPNSGVDDLDDLLGAATPRLVEWLRVNSLQADGSRSKPAIVAPNSLSAVLAAAASAEPDWRLRVARRLRPGWQIVHTSLLRLSCKLTASDIASRLSIGRDTVNRYVALHRQLLVRDDAYTQRCSTVLAQALARLR